MRPKTSKQPRGSILKPDEYPLGYTRHTHYEVEQIVERLYPTPAPRSRQDDAGRSQSTAASSTSPHSEHPSRMGGDHTPLSREQVDEIVRNFVEVLEVQYSTYCFHRRHISTILLCHNYYATRTNM